MHNATHILQEAITSFHEGTQIQHHERWVDWDLILTFAYSK
jgi:hypothetical protein